MDVLYVIFVSVVIFLVEDISANIKILSCHSVNVVPKNIPTEYVFISTKKEDCTFIFEGPEDTKLDMEVRAISFPKRYTESENCRKSKLTVYNYIDSKVILGKLVCNENEKANLLTKSNMGIVTSSLTDGSFSIKILPQKEQEDLLKLEADMYPPHPSSEDYFLLERDNNEGFKPIPSGFKPSAPFLSQTYPSNHNTAYPYHPHRPGFYPGKPSEIIDITYNSTGHNFTIITVKPNPLQSPSPITNHHSQETIHPSSTSKPSPNYEAPIVQHSNDTLSSKPPTYTTTVQAQASSTTSIEPLEEE